MSFTGLADNQAVSYTNLQDAVTNGIFTLVSAITSTGQESTKSYVAAHVSGFNPNYPPYALKATNQLIVKNDIYQTGNFILDAQYGMSFTSMSGSVGLPTFQPSAFSFPVTGGNTTKQYNGTIAAQTITIGLTGTRVITPLKVVLYVDGVQVDCKDITANGVQTKTLNLSVTVASPSTVKISINGGTCSIPNPVFTGKCFSTVSVNRGSGQYMVAGNAKIFGNPYPGMAGWTAGYLYYSSDYGSTWGQNSTYGYWKKIASSDNGQYVIAVEVYGKAYLSSNYGVSFTQISGLTYSSDFYQGAALSNDGQYQMIVSGHEFSSNNSIVQVSTNYGSTWTTVRSDSYANFYSCAMDSSGGTFLVGGGVGGSSFMIRSTDQGATWTSVHAGSNNGASVNDININASNGWAIATQPGTSFLGSYLVKSSNSGSSWTNISGGSAQQSWMVAIVNNTVSGKALYYLSDTGTSYIQQITGAGPSFLNTVSDLTSSGNRNWHALSNNDGGTYVLAGAGDGLYLSTNGGSTWSSL